MTQQFADSNLQVQQKPRSNAFWGFKTELKEGLGLLKIKETEQGFGCFDKKQGRGGFVIILIKRETRPVHMF